MPDTSYIVLRLGGPSETSEPRWHVVDSHVLATSADQAIRKTAKDDGTYVATPARSFKPVAVKTVQTTTLKLDSSPEPT